MKIAITTPTGHVGSAVADLLLEQGGDIEVKLLGRRPHALASLVRRGAETAIGLQDDAEYLGKALCDVDALFWVTPPGYGFRQRARIPESARQGGRRGRPEVQTPPRGQSLVDRRAVRLGSRSHLRTP